MITALL